MKNLIRSTVVLAGSVVLTGALYAKETSTTLFVHHFMSSKSPTHTKLLMPWAKKLSEASNGKIKVEIFPSMTMGGKPGELYKQARNGSADIVWTIAGYTPGVFPRTEVYELPTVHTNSALATNLAIKENFDLIKDDFKDVMPLLIHVHAGNAIHTTKKEIKNPSDLKGLKLRTPSRTGGWLISELGADPVGMPLPSIPTALSKNAIDGMLIPFEVFPPYKFYQLTNHSAEGANNERFGTSVFMLLMNKDKFNGLSKKLQDIIVANSGMDLVKSAGKLFMNVETPGKKMQEKSGSTIQKYSPEILSEFDKASKRVVAKWIGEANKKGINGNKLVETARKSIEKYSK